MKNKNQFKPSQLTEEQLKKKLSGGGKYAEKARKELVKRSK